VDLAFQIRDAVASVQALESDNPVLDVPLPCPVPGISFTVEIPLGSGEATPPVALCMSPDAPSLTGGWALEAAAEETRPEDDHKGGPDQPRDDATEAAWERALQRSAANYAGVMSGESRTYSRPLCSGYGSPVGCLIEIDMESWGLLKGRKLRAFELYVLADTYAALFRGNLGVASFEVLVITNTGRRSGLWIWLGSSRP
jgi:hypothetical protein